MKYWNIGPTEVFKIEKGNTKNRRQDVEKEEGMANDQG